MGDSWPGGGDPLGSGCPVNMLGGGTTPGAPPVPGAFIIFLYLDRRFWNQILTCKIGSRKGKVSTRISHVVYYVIEVA